MAYTYQVTQQVTYQVTQQVTGKYQMMLWLQGTAAEAGAREPDAEDGDIRDAERGVADAAVSAG